MGGARLRRRGGVLQWPRDPPPPPPPRACFPAGGAGPAGAGEPLPEWRRDFDREVIRLLGPYPFDIGMLAGYMLIATELLCERYDLLNLHPAAPDGPAGR